MKKKTIAILVSAIVVAVLVIIVVLFNIKTYDVLFDTNGGSEVPAQKVKVFKKVDRPMDPVKEGYTFDKWYYNDGIFDFDTKITEDIVLEARWIEGNPVAGTHIVSFNSNGGSSVASVRTNTDGTVNQPKDPTREGYKFVSWQLKGKDFDFSTKITSNTTLVAKWEEEDTNVSSVPAEKVSLSPTSFSLQVGGLRRVQVALSPKEAVNRTMKWTSSNMRVATVDNLGNVRAVAAGSAVITCEVDGKKASVSVTVTKPVTPPVVDPEPVNPNPPVVDPEPVEPDPPVVDPEPEKITYSVEKVAIPSSAMNEVYLKIKSSKGEYVAGTIRWTTFDGVVTDINVSASGSDPIPGMLIASYEVISPK